MSCMEGKVWIEGHNYPEWEYEVSQDVRCSFKTKSYSGPFDTWHDAVDYVESRGMKGVIIHDFT